MDGALVRHSHSGETLEVLSIDGQPMVRKTFHANLLRARRNVDKQHRFPTITAGAMIVRAAPVYSFEQGADHSVLTMPYIDGHVGDDIALYGGWSVSRQLRSALSEVVYRAMADSEVASRPTLLFVHKLEEVLGRTAAPSLSALLLALHERLTALPEELDFPLGPCHGDLTLSNVIMAPGQNVVLIDFLDTYLESPLQDLAKLSQEFEHGWSFRASPRVLQVRGEVFLRESQPLALRQFGALYPLQTWLMTALCLARIAPYVGNAMTAQWLAASLRRVLDQQPALSAH